MTWFWARAAAGAIIRNASTSASERRTILIAILPWSKWTALRRGWKHQPCPRSARWEASGTRGQRCETMGPCVLRAEAEEPAARTLRHERRGRVLHAIRPGRHAPGARATPRG